MGADQKEKKKACINLIRAGIFGTVVGDALGVPVEFTSRAERKADPVTDMRGYGTHSQPKGTWSDDSSMALATMDSMIRQKGIHCDDIMEKFKGWLLHGDYTPYGRVFDVGITCRKAIGNYKSGCDATMCGGDREDDNGNGSLMRIMPVSLYESIRHEDWEENEQHSVMDDVASDVHDASSLTHRHPRSRMACMIYTAICHEMIQNKGGSLQEVLQSAVNRTLDFYGNAEEARAWSDEAFLAEIRSDHFRRLRDLDAFRKLPEEEISSGGYVLHTLEASIWCLLQTDSYRDCVLKAVNLGDDTDTTGAVTGGLVGLWYGYDAIPQEWLDVIASREWIDSLCEQFAEVCAL